MSCNLIQLKLQQTHLLNTTLLKFSVSTKALMDLVFAYLDNFLHFCAFLQAAGLLEQIKLDIWIHPAISNCIMKQARTFKRLRTL